VPSIQDHKSELRKSLAKGRRARSAQDRALAASANTSHLLGLLAGSSIVCAFLPLPSEPLGTDLLDELTASGTIVVVPVVTVDSPMHWCQYPGPSAAGAFGILEPTGPRLAPDYLLRADVVLVPAFAVDLQGQRLGRGGGHYDRSLALLETVPQTSRPELIAVLFDGEVVTSLPTDCYDVSVDSAVQPASGLRRFRR